MDTAIHVWISELLNAKQQEQDFILEDGRTANKARIYATAVSTDELIVDDGTGSILVRTFETPFKVNLGDPVLVIGRPRIYAQQCYILGEIVKKIDKKWLEIREKQHPQKNPLEIVKMLDNGEGADYDKVAEKIGEEKITYLMAKGELFETKPGKIKVLE